MNRNDALETVRTLLRSTSALGYLVARGPAWPSPDKCAGYKKAIGTVMANAYCILLPIWEEHPALQPGSQADNDPLGLKTESAPPDTTPAGLIPYLDETQRATNWVLSRMLQDASIGRHKEFIEATAKHLEEAIAQAKRICEGNSSKC